MASSLAMTAIYKIINGSRDWRAFTFLAGSKPYTSLGEGIDVRVVKYITDERIADEWGEYDQGTDGVQSLVFEVRGPDDTLTYVRKDGRCDSYGRETWEGAFYEVAVKEVTVQDYVKV